MVAEPTTNIASDSHKQLVGVVDVTVLRDKSVLQHLPAEVEEYLYVSGIAVLKSFRLNIYIYIYIFPSYLINIYNWYQSIFSLRTFDLAFLFGLKMIVRFINV